MSSRSDATLPARGLSRPVYQRGRAHRSLWSDAWRRLARDRMALLGGLIIVLLIALALLAPFIRAVFWDARGPGRLLELPKADDMNRRKATDMPLSTSAAPAPCGPKVG